MYNNQGVQDEGGNIVEFDGKTLTIKLQIENLINCVNLSPENNCMEIIDAQGYGEYLVDELFSDDEGYGGIPKFFDIFEDLAYRAYEYAKDFTADVDNEE